MKICAVPSCKNDSTNRPDLTFFCLPRTSNVKAEWLSAIGGLKVGLSQQFIKVCEVHFKRKDFVNGKKQLKFHAIPVLQLGDHKSESLDSEEEFILFDSDDDSEVQSLTSFRKSSETEDNIKMEIEPDTEEEGRRRPTRRAAQVAAKKILNTARNIVENVEDKVYVPASPRTGQRQRSRISKMVLAHVDVDLQMECNDDTLSEIQVESMLKAQIEYNQVMKRLRNLKSQNVKIIEVDSYDISALVQAPVPILLTTAK